LLTLFVVPSMYGIMYRFGRVIMQIMFTLVLLATGIVLYLLFNQILFLILGGLLVVLMIGYIVYDLRKGIAYE
jgi:FtsH-binding integral membrane protein